MDRTDQLKQELNRELRKEGRLQRAGLRKCRIVCQVPATHLAQAFAFEPCEDLTVAEKYILMDEMWIDGNEGFLQSKEEFYFHGAFPKKLLETEGGVLFETEIPIRFVT